MLIVNLQLQNYFYKKSCESIAGVCNPVITLICAFGSGLEIVLIATRARISEGDASRLIKSETPPRETFFSIAFV